MNSKPIHIVCAVDLSEYSIAVIEHALDEAHRHTNVVLHFITVLETDRSMFTKKVPTSAQLEEIESRLRGLVEESLPTFSDTNDAVKRRIRFHVRVGRPDDEIVELAYEAQASRVIVGRHGARNRNRRTGSIATRIVESAPCTVLVVQAAQYEPAEHNYAHCPTCVQVRESSGGEQWFCKEHNLGRTPRLSQSVGTTSSTPGWGLF